MADQKITQLLGYTVPNSQDVFAIVDIENGITKKIALGDLLQRVVIGSGSNTVTITASGLLFAGDAKFEDDLRITPSAMDLPGVSDPAMGDWQPGGSGRLFKTWVYDSTDVAMFVAQLPHGYDSQDISVHCHWTPRDRATVESGNTVSWRLDYTWADINGIFGPSAVASMDDTCTGSNHAHLMTPQATIPGSGHGLSSMLQCAIYRAAGDTWQGVGAANGPALLEVDF